MSCDVKRMSKREMTFRTSIIVGSVVAIIAMFILSPTEIGGKTAKQIKADYDAEIAKISAIDGELREFAGAVYLLSQSNASPDDLMSWKGEHQELTYKWLNEYELGLLQRSILVQKAKKLGEKIGITKLPCNIIAYRYTRKHLIARVRQQRDDMFQKK
jgi:hypothetical protein